MFILEANFDGEAGPFWGQLESLLADDLRAIARSCKRPLDGTGPLYDAVVAAESRVPIAQYYEVRTQQPSVFHHGNRGLSRDRIISEAALFDEVRVELDAVRAPGDSYRTPTPAAVHARLRERMLSTHAWLGSPAPERITSREQTLDGTKLAAFAIATLFALSLPGFVLALLLPLGAYIAYIAAIAILAAIALFLVWRMRDPLPGTDVPTDFSLWSFLKVNVQVITFCVGATLLGLVPVAVAISFLLSLVGGVAAPLTFREALAILVGTHIFCLQYLKQPFSEP